MIIKLTLKLSKQLLLFVISGALVALAAGLAAAVYLLESQAHLKPWHEPLLTKEFHETMGLQSFDAYLELEDELFEELEHEVLSLLPDEERTPINRYNQGSLSDPENWPRNWNRSYVLEQPGASAIFVLIHGMSDSPYSLRNLALSLHASGGEVIGLRLPGHGTIPSGLLEATWKDMAGAVDLAVAEAKRRADAGDGAEVYLVGYSIGAALSVHHALAAIEAEGGIVDGLLLLSPAIGLSRLAMLAPVQAKMGHLIGFRKVAWNAINLEYDPFKYGSFPINAAHQSFLITEDIKKRLDRLSRDRRLAAMPPILAFQSVVDATVSTQAVIQSLFQKLPTNGHELVLFDVNRRTDAGALLSNDPGPMIEGLLVQEDLPFTLTLLRNQSQESREVIMIRRAPGSKTAVETDLGMSWPDDVFSLSHVALPFPANDPLYGDGSGPQSPGIELGVLALRGERGVLRVTANDMLRLRWNPFYSFIEERVQLFVEENSRPHN